MDVRLPDGTIVKGVPDGMSKADLTSMLAKNGYDVSSLASAPPAKTESPSGIGRQLGLTARYGIEGASAGAGMITDPFVTAIGGAVRAVTGNEYNPQTLASIGQHVANALGLPQPNTQTERMVGAVSRGLAGAATPAAIASKVAGATTGQAQQVASQLAAQPALQAASGAAAAGAGQGVAEAGGGTGAQIAAALAAGVSVPAAMAGINKVSALRGASINPSQQAILDAGEAANVPVMTSDILPPKNFINKQLQAVGERIPVAGTGGLRQAQQVSRQNSVADMVEQYGKPDYEAIVGSVKGRVGGIKKAAGRVINQTGVKLDAAGPVAPVKSVQAIDDAIANLSRPQVYKPGYQSYIDDLQAVKDSFSANPTYTNLRESRTALREVMDSVDPMGRSQLPSQTKALFAKTYSALKNDMDDFAAANLPQNQIDKLNRANIVYGETAGLLKNTRLKNVLDKGDVTPEVVRNMIYSNKPSENKILYDSLGQAGRNQVKSVFINDAAERALRSGEINPNAFAVELAKHDKKLGVFFKGDERDAVRGFVKLLQVTKRGQDAAAAPTTTGAIALPYAAGAAAITDLGATLTVAASTGGLARLYESARVRDLLLKLSNVPPNSAQAEKYALGIASALREEEQRTQEQPAP